MTDDLAAAFQPPKPEPRLKIEAFNVRRWAVQEAMEILAKFQPADLPVSPYVVVFVAQYLETGRMPAAEDEPTWELDKATIEVNEERVDELRKANR